MKTEKLKEKYIKYELTKDDVMEALKEVYDPEIPVNVVDLGLVYNVAVEDN